MSFRKTLLLVAASLCYVSSSLPATLRSVDVSRRQDRYRVVADTYLDASPAIALAVLPLIGRIAKEFTAWLAPLYGEDLRLWYDADQIAGLTVERDALWTRVGAAAFLTDDEKREAVGYEPASRP